MASFSVLGAPSQMDDEHESDHLSAHVQQTQTQSPHRSLCWIAIGCASGILITIAFLATFQVTKIMSLPEPDGAVLTKSASRPSESTSSRAPSESSGPSQSRAPFESRQCVAYCYGRYLCDGCPGQEQMWGSRGDLVECAGLCDKVQAQLRKEDVVADGTFCSESAFCKPDTAIQQALLTGSFAVPPAIKRVWFDVGCDWTTFFSRCNWPEVLWRTPIDDAQAPQKVTCEHFKESPDLLSIAIDANSQYQQPLANLARVIGIAGVAVAEDLGIVVFKHAVGEGCSSILEPEKNDGIPAPCANVASRQVLPVLPLWFLFELLPQRFRVQFLKVDAQGADLMVVKSLGAKLGLVDKVFVEAQEASTKYPLTAGQTSKEEVMAYMAQHGFLYNTSQSAIENQELLEWNLMFDHPR